MKVILKAAVLLINVLFIQTSSKHVKASLLSSYHLYRHDAKRKASFSQVRRVGAYVRVNPSLMGTKDLYLEQTILNYRGGGSYSNDESNSSDNHVATSYTSAQQDGVVPSPNTEENTISNTPPVPQVVGGAEPTIETTTTQPEIPKKKSSKDKIQNAIERTIPAIIMLTILHQLIHHTGELGMYMLIPLLQFKMYKESTGIIEEYYMNKVHNGNGNGTNGKRGNNFDLEVNIEKWWWFITFTVTTSGRFLCNDLFKSTTTVTSNPVTSFLYSIIQNEDQFNLIVYGMVSIGLTLAVVGMASHNDASADKFRSYLGEIASFHFALVFLVGQSSFWIQTIHYFGLAWVLYPALLVIVNDTMAYVFGVCFGKHKLLPRLSPNKTIEGFAGAAVSTIGVSIPLLHLFVSYVEKRLSASSVSGSKFLLLFKDTSITAAGVEDALLPRSKLIRQHALVMALYTSLISPFGGFLASAVKRAHFAKDFGTLIPGHGGVVDRFDCQVVTAPFVFLYLQWFYSTRLN